MSAPIFTSTSSLSSQRTIPRASRVGNGRLQNRWAGERPAEPLHEPKPPNPVGSVNGAAEKPSYRSPESLEELFVTPPLEARGRRLKMASKGEPPYTSEKPRKPQIDFLA